MELFAQHVVKTNNENEWENRKFLELEPHWIKRTLKEALITDCRNSKEKSDTIMNLEK